jgi:hypothetical protein
MRRGVINTKLTNRQMMGLDLLTVPPFACIPQFAQMGAQTGVRANRIVPTAKAACKIAQRVVLRSIYTT